MDRAVGGKRCLIEPAPFEPATCRTAWQFNYAKSARSAPSLRPARLGERRAREAMATTRQQKAVVSITSSMGSMPFVDLHLAFYGAWCAGLSECWSAPEKWPIGVCPHDGAVSPTSGYLPLASAFPRDGLDDDSGRWIG
jgi:hypothetical protein